MKDNFISAIKKDDILPLPERQIEEGTGGRYKGRPDPLRKDEGEKASKRVKEGGGATNSERVDDEGLTYEERADLEDPPAFRV